MIGVAVVIFGVVIALPWLRPPRPSYDENNCAARVPVKGQWIVIVDHTDAFEKQDAARIENLVRRKMADVALGERMSFYVFGGDVQQGGRIEPLQSKCSSGKWNEVERFWSNQNTVEKRYTEKFHDPLSKSIPDLTKSESFPASPILEALFDIATRPEYVESPGGKRIVIVSDMMQNSASLSFYKQGSKTIATDGLIPAFSGIAAGRERALRKFDLEVYQLFVHKDPKAALQARHAWEMMLRPNIGGQNLQWHAF